MPNSRKKEPHRSAPLVATARQDLERRFGETFLLLNEIAASLSLIERTCGHALEQLPVKDEVGLSRAVALRRARAAALGTLEQIGDLADTVTALLRFFSRDKRRAREAR